ncbi:MAG: hypothetical protein ACO2PM_10055 [Pyrobaculum sp.]|mgnify:FL=1|jgi:hypothetical protein
MTKLVSQKRAWTEIPVTCDARQKLAIAKAKYGFRTYNKLINHYD